MTQHILKIMPAYFDAVNQGIKTCEVRRADRDYRVGDLLHLREYDAEYDDYTGRTVEAVVRHILRHEDFPDGVPDGYVVMSIGVVR